MKNLLLSFLVSFIILSCKEKSIYHVELLDSETIDTLTISDINLYLESSVSMKGYVNVNTSGNYPLKEIIPFLITDLDDTYNLNTNLFTYSDAAKKFPSTKQIFFNQLRSGDILGGKSSKLQNIFSEIISNTENGSINILITDCIVDLGTQDTFSEGGLVTAEIYSELLKKDNMGVAVFQYLSDFNGTYYFDRKNTGGRNENERPFHNTTLQNRPFYVWIFGHRSLVEEILEKNIIKEYNGSHFYNLKLGTENIGILTEPKSGKIAVFPSKNEVLIDEVSPKKPTKFTIGLKLNHQSDVFKDIIMDSGNYRIEPDFIKSIDIEAFDKSLLLENIKNKSSIEKEGYNYFIQPIFNDFDLNTEEITIRLINKQPEWIANTNLSDDLNISAANLENKTFSFQYIINAFDKMFSEEELLRIKMTKN